MNKILLFGTALLLVAANSFSQASNYPNGSTVANFTVTDTDGNTIDLYTITASGKYVLLDFFFDTCPPCQASQPIFNEFHDKYGCNAGDVFCASINNGTDNDAAVIAYEATYGGSFHHSPAVSSDGGSTAVKNAFGVSAYPTYCLVGPDNKMVMTDIWPVDNVGSLEAAFPASAITEMACSFASLEEQGLSNLTMYPIPSSTEINVNFTSVSNSVAQIEIYNLLGEKIETIVSDVIIGKNIVQIGLSDYAAGQYMIAIKMDDFVETAKFTVVK
jgi:thiol-disulfide isomerase/thioredoxin